MKILRAKNNPLLTPEDVIPSRPDFKVDGIFNCGVAKYKDEILLLCRVAESVRSSNDKEIKIPIVVKKDKQDTFDCMVYQREKHPELDFSDTRCVRSKENGKIKNLTSLSHLRLARSKDGIHFQVDEKPVIFPISEEESWGMEDPRITQIDTTYYITYTSVTQNGAAVSMMSTNDFSHFKRHGIIFAPENKDVVIFPKKIDGKYVAFHRPVPYGIGNPDMWIAKSPDLLHWGEHRHFSGTSEKTENSWDNERIGAGAVPFLTDKGWVEIYHAADDKNRYCLGALLLDKEDPSKIIGKTKSPLLQPEADYEKEGFFDDVVFTCGCLLEQNKVIIYYGAADDKICRADILLEDLFRKIEKL